MGDGTGSAMTEAFSVLLESSSCNGAGVIRLDLDSGVGPAAVPFCFVTECFRLIVGGVDTVRDERPGVGDTELLEVTLAGGRSCGVA